MNSIITQEPERCKARNEVPSMCQVPPISTTQESAQMTRPREALPASLPSLALPSPEHRWLFAIHPLVFLDDLFIFYLLWG